MLRLVCKMATVALVMGGLTPIPTAGQAPASGRALRIDDYYRIQTVGNHSLSPDGKWVTYTVTTRLEEPDTNSNRIDSWLVPSDGSAEPRRVQHGGKDVSNPTWADDGWLQFAADGQRWKTDPDNPSTAPVQIAGGPAAAGRGGRGGRGGGRGGEGGTPSPDGHWDVAAVNKPRDEAKPAYASDFEKRHEERFKGVTFDWKDFQRDGAAVPGAESCAHARRSSSSCGRSAAARRKSLVDMDLRPANIAWHPNGQMIAFTADPDWRERAEIRAHPTCGPSRPTARSRA